MIVFCLTMAFATFWVKRKPSPHNYETVLPVPTYWNGAENKPVADPAQVTELLGEIAPRALAQYPAGNLGFAVEREGKLIRLSSQDGEGKADLYASLHLAAVREVETRYAPIVESSRNELTALVAAIDRELEASSAREAELNRKIAALEGQLDTLGRSSANTLLVVGLGTRRDAMVTERQQLLSSRRTGLRERYTASNALREMAKSGSAFATRSEAVPSTAGLPRRLLAFAVLSLLAAAAAMIAIDRLAAVRVLQRKAS